MYVTALLQISTFLYPVSGSVTFPGVFTSSFEKLSFFFFSIGIWQSNFWFLLNKSLMLKCEQNVQKLNNSTEWLRSNSIFLNMNWMFHLKKCGIRVLLRVGFLYAVQLTLQQHSHSKVWSCVQSVLVTNYKNCLNGPFWNIKKKNQKAMFCALTNEAWHSLSVISGSAVTQHEHSSWNHWLLNFWWMLLYFSFFFSFSLYVVKCLLQTLIYNSWNIHMYY